MKTNTFYKFLFLCSCASAQTLGFAQSLIEYKFTKGSGLPTFSISSGLNATPVVPNGNTGLSSNAGNAYVNGLGNVGAPSSQYLEFTLTPASGYSLDISKIHFNFGQESSEYSISLSIRSSLDDFKTSLAEKVDFETVASGVTSTPESIEFIAEVASSKTGFRDIKSPITFRIYGWGDNRFGPRRNSESRRIRIDDIIVEGTINRDPQSSGL